MAGRRIERPSRPRTKGLVLAVFALLALGSVLFVRQTKGLAWPVINTWQASLANVSSVLASVAQPAADADAQPAAAAAGAVAAAASKPQKQPLTDAIKRRCEGTLGNWCIDFHTQAEVPAVTAPRGNRTCSLNCNQVGTCSALTGLCTCPAGWQGFNCLMLMPRHCASRYSYFGYERGREEPNVTKGVGLPSIWAFPESHCAGTCDETTALCFCPSNTTYGRRPAPEDAPPGAPPVQRGRPMGQFCQPNRTPDGQETAWGTIDPQDLYGPEGWCMAAEPKHQCPCTGDGWGGKNCEEPAEMFCFNQCNGRGTCIGGYCRCHKGWHGIDCAHQSAAVEPELPAELPAWVAEHVHTPAAADFPANATRKRPLIYVYELPSDYGTLYLQYRNGGEACVPRLYGLPGNGTHLSGWTYSVEAGFLEALLQSEHRTLDPEEADYFFIPLFPACFIHPVRDSADSLRDFYYSVAYNRVQGATNLMLEAWHWLRSHHPYWDRRGGRDHILISAHDEGSCWVPAALRPAIVLSHWGRKDANHTSGTAYGADNYSADLHHPQFEPEGWLRKLGKHPCYDPQKDLVIPLMKIPNHYHLSPLIGGPASNRTWLAFHRGRVQKELPEYSRGVRQRLAEAAEKGGWLEKYRIAVGEHDKIQGDYSELLSSSEFCLVLMGDGWSARMDDATLHGCIPVIIMDEIDVSFESIIDLSAFTVRIAQADAEKLPDILLAIPHEKRQEMRAALAKVWQRFTYSSYRPYAKRFRELQQQHAEAAKAAQAAAAVAAGAAQQQQQQQQPLSLPATVADLDPAADDAFSTIMAWLHSQIQHTR